MRGNAELRTDQPGRSRVPVPEELRKSSAEELDRVLEGQDFRNSRRGQLLLRYLVDHALAGDLDSFKERTIGIHVFARDANYDTGQDAIVRVAANDVRKRLADHYERRRAAGLEDAVQISIPHGSYAPEFRESLQAAMPAEPPPPVPVPPPPSRKITVIGVIAAILAVLCLALAAQNFRLRSELAEGRLPDVLPWPMLSDSAKQIGVVVSDSGFGIAQESIGRETPLPEYADGSWTAAFRQNFPTFAIFPNVPVTSLASVVLVSRITALLEKSGYTALVRSPRALRLTDLKAGHPLVLLGSSHANPWVGLLNDKLNFRIEVDPKLGRQVCVNASPRAGELPVYVTTAHTGSAGVSFATISLVPNLQHNAFLLILAGSNMEGTEAAGEFATDLPLLSDTLRRLQIDSRKKIEQLELLMRVQVMGASSGRSEVIAQRVTYAR